MIKAVIGGSFDPIHLGHLNMAKRLLKNKLCDEVVFMPSLATPLKLQSKTNYKLRLKMVKETVKPYKKMSVSDLESKLGSTSYTYNTVLQLIKQNPNDTFLWVIGYDQYVNLCNWYKIDELLQLIKFVVFSRDNQKIDDDRFIVINDFNYLISSTQIRNGNFNYLSKPVKKIIYDNLLYFDNIVKLNMSEFRYLHSVAVKDTALLLGKIYNVDLNKCYIAAMLHDICKECDLNDQQLQMQVCFSDKIVQNKKIWHGYLGANYIKDKLNIYDYDIYNAIYHHVLGTGNSVLAKIIYVADKANHLRSYEVSGYLNVASYDLDQAMLMIKNDFDEIKNKG